MQVIVADLKKGLRGIITDVSPIFVPLKLLEMGCLPGNYVELVQGAFFSNPMCLNINGKHLAIRKETTLHILIKIL